MSTAAFYVLPWSVVAAQAERCAALQQVEGGPREPMCCHSALTSWEALRADPSQLVLGHVHWGEHWAARDRFEAEVAAAGGVALGDPWERVPPGAIAVLEQFRLAHLPLRAGGARSTSVGRPELDANVPIDATHTVTAALRKAVPMFAHEQF